MPTDVLLQDHAEEIDLVCNWSSPRSTIDRTMIVCYLENQKKDNRIVSLDRPWKIMKAEGLRTVSL